MTSDFDTIRNGLRADWRAESALNRVEAAAEQTEKAHGEAVERAEQAERQIAVIKTHLDARCEHLVERAERAERERDDVRAALETLDMQQLITGRSVNAPDIDALDAVRAWLALDSEGIVMTLVEDPSFVDYVRDVADLVDSLDLQVRFPSVERLHSDVAAPGGAVTPAGTASLPDVCEVAPSSGTGAATQDDVIGAMQRGMTYLFERLARVEAAAERFKDAVMKERELREAAQARAAALAEALAEARDWIFEDYDLETALTPDYGPGLIPDDAIVDAQHEMNDLSRDQTVALAYLRREGEASESALAWEGLHAPWRTLDALSRRGLVVRGEWFGPEDGHVWTLAADTKDTR